VLNFPPPYRSGMRKSSIEPVGWRMTVEHPSHNMSVIGAA
jgi:hypothetical protein